MGKFYRNASKLSLVRKKLANIKRRNRRDKKNIAKKLGVSDINIKHGARKVLETEIHQDKVAAILDSCSGNLGQIQKRNKKRFFKTALADLSSSAVESPIDESGFEYSDHFNRQMFRSYFREFKKVVEAADVVIEVLDARDPLGTRCSRIEQMILDSGSNKRLVLLLNKIDLIPRENLEKWLKYLRQEFPTVAFKASTQTQADHLSHAKIAAIHMSESMQSTRRCVGANFLLKVLGNYCRNQNILTSIKVGVVGFPNVGKSSIINSLKRSRACTVGATPGVTKNMQEIALDKHIRLLDSPGVVFGKEGTLSSLALHNAVKIEKLDDPISPAEAIMQRADRKQLMEYYKIEEFKSAEELLCYIAQRMGRFKKGGIPDKGAAARKLLNDWNSGVIKYFTEPPETYLPTVHVSAELVTEMGKAFDISAAEEVMELDKLFEEDAKAGGEGTGTQQGASGMDTDQGDGGEVTVKFGKKKKGKESDSQREQYLRPEFQQNRARKNAFKKMRKKAKKDRKNAAMLSDIVTSALCI